MASRKIQTATVVRMILTCLCLATAVGQAAADMNQTPIAVPLLGDQGAGSPYPSRIRVTPRGGPTQSAQPRIVLQAVTHPCLQDLAVLLVHNSGSQKYLLMSHAGGCRPLQGADLVIQTGYGPLPASDPSTVPISGTVVMDLSNYGTVPVFPAPAPAGPYATVLPGVLIAGDWDLYVMDTGPGHRGVIAAGWTINYSTDLTFSPEQALPAFIPAGAPAQTQGPASVYPITFDLGSVAAGATVSAVRLDVALAHSYAADVNILLQAPNGQAVVVMANCGGGFPLANTVLSFADSSPNTLGAFTAISFTSYRPGTCAPVATPPGGGPLPPFGASFSTLNGQHARGTWKLWVYDDAPAGTGSISQATLTVGTDLAPTFTIDVPTSGTTYTANTPFLHLEGVIGPALAQGPYSATWYSMVGGTYYQSGPMTLTADHRAAADIPLKKGSNFIQVFVRNTPGIVAAADDLDVTVNEFVYTLSEGATGGFFDLDVTIANPTGIDAPVSISLLPEHATPIPYALTAPANAPRQLHVNDLVPGDGVSTIVHSTDAIPLAVERTMSWDKTGYGGSGGTAIQPHTQWLFAEGSQGYFDTFILLANDGDADANATVRFLIQGGSPVDVPTLVPAHKRVTLFAGDVPAVRNTSFGMDISADRPITAERSMYFPHDGPRTWEGGHEAAGANATSTHWFLAEGATGPFFECFILLSNPNSTIAHASLTYLLPDGTTVPQSIDVPGGGRQTINVETVNPRLANVAVSTTITADIGIIVERSMYWPDISIGWREAHNSVGVTDPALRWAVSDGRNGGARASQTYMLLANPNSTPAEVLVRFLKAGATPVTKNYTLLPTSRLNIGPDDVTPLIGEGLFSADIQVLNYQPIVVEKALYWNSGSEVWAAGTGTVGTPIPPP
jgi:subtilisin-like proprotein convertase family protein